MQWPPRPELPPGSVVIPDGNAQMTGRVAHDDVDGILPCVPDTVVVRDQQARRKAFGLGHGVAPLERAGSLPAVALKAAGPGNPVAQAAGRAVIARGGVENFDAEGNPVFPGRLETAEIVAVFQQELDDHAARSTFCCRHARQREALV